MKEPVKPRISLSSFILMSQSTPKPKIQVTVNANGKTETKSCGFLVIQECKAQQEHEETLYKLLLIKTNNDGFDLPKGHMDEGETDELLTAYRELEEESGIDKAKVIVHPHFRFQNSYTFTYKRKEMQGIKATKTLVLFLAKLVEEVEIKLEKQAKGFVWVSLTPGMDISKYNPSIKKAITSLLKHMEDYPMSEFV